MNDHEIDRLVATAAPVRDGWLDGLDLRDAESELMEEIMATGNAPATTPSAPSTREEPPTAQLSPIGRTPRLRRRSRLAVAAGLVAAAMIGVVVLRVAAGNGNGDDGGNVHVGAEPEIRPMIADPLPEGFAVSYAYPVDGPAAAPASGPADTWVYGDLTPTAITNDVVIETAPAQPEGNTLAEPVTVRGREAGLCSPGPHQCDFGNDFTGVSWTEKPGMYITVQSRTFDSDQVLAIAEGLAVEGDTIELGDLPAGVTRPPRVAELDHEWDWTYIVQYETRDPEVSVSVSTRPETDAMRAYDLWLYGPRDDGTVQGRPVALKDIDVTHVLTWEPAPGQLIEVMASGVDEGTARAFAETVRPATDGEWAEVQALAQAWAQSGPRPDDPAFTEPPPDGAAHRPLAEGSTEVWGWQDDDGVLCYQVDVDGEESEQLCADDKPETTVLGVSPTNDGGELIWDVPAVVGVAPAGTVAIDGGEVTFGGEVDGGRLFVWELTDGEMPGSLTFRDADGNELTTIDVFVV